ncbi:hypothetical protein K435DRAFT_876586 [Dendrothele bispora CBS 962.96]|uniref:Prolyl 4-hydroxylase alpha subunit Fe(2+) 2OG dioxygenase domain-containing protein n=1 Tax=Dendrothele bispora (strain CBS 962.96) TaxID=1314807 RepID=A0A4S8KS16_DENBC|nr:hypothetical protein K435DRAFT_876586 [Dendrothele bispora CBS 962.96]
MYGPGDKFDEHPDTPQTGLVNWVAAGDNTWSCHLVVDGNESSATEGSWVAFYPDVPHKVLSGDNLLSMDSELCAAAERLLANLEV